MNKKQQADSGIHDTSAHCPRVYQFLNLLGHSSWEKCDEKFNVWKIGEKEIWKNKGTNNHQQSNSGTHDTSVHFPRMYRVSIF